MAKAPPIAIGERHGSLVVVEDAGTGRHPNGQSVHYFMVRCNCGAVVRMNNNVVRKRSMCPKCGCAAAGRKRVQHGAAKRNERHRLYNVWLGIKNRCQNPNSTSFAWYGGKGVKLCPEWQDYRVFRAWALENGWAPGLTFDREDSSGDYCPNNCRFITQSENSKRMRAEQLAREAA